MDTTDQPNSICHVQSIHMYPLQPSNTKDVPFNLLAGETVLHVGHSVDGVVVVTTYRLYLQSRSKPFHIPVSLIEVVEIRELFNLHIGCKDARTYRCTFENNEKCQMWCDQIVRAAEPPRQVEQLFAFYHCIWSKEKGGEEVIMRLENQRQYTFDRRLFENEMCRLGFQGHSWRISKVNENYKFCPTYPPYLLVPSCINDDMLESVAKFRSSRRIPAVVWRHVRNGAVIVRSSQPEVGWLGWRSAEDEDLIKAISEACNFDRSCSKNFEPKESNLSCSPGSLHSDESVIPNNIDASEKKFLIMDARSYTTAVANRARGGGCEYPEYYPNCEIQFMNLANIHSIRKSFHALRQLCTYSADQPNWYSQLEGTRWLSHMSGLMKAAVTLVAAVERDARPVLVHCSDGWDRTPQIVALAELLLDPYYRTIDGFRILIEREWLAFGHKFADRCGHSSGSDDQNERCPVFLQWLDCVHQLLLQFPCAFEFSQIFLVKLVQHVYSNLFGTFLCNTQRERSKIVYGKTFSIWDFLNSPCFRNHLYPTIGTNTYNRRVLWPQYNVRDLYLWSEVYLGSIEDSSNPEESSNFCPETCDSSPNYMTKTRSYGDLINDGESSAYHYRRSSDPSIKCDPKMVLTSKETKTNGHDTIHLDDRDQQNFLSNFLLDDGDCNQDCMFNGNNISTDDQIAELEQADRKVLYAKDQPDFGEPPPLVQELHRNSLDLLKEIDKPSVSNGESEVYNGVIKVKRETDEVSRDALKAGVLLKDEKTGDNGDINHNSNGNSETSCTVKDDNERSESDCVMSGDVVGTFLDMERSNETSTETLVGEDTPSVNGSNCNGNQQDERERSKNSNSPQLTTVSNGWDNSLHNLTQQKNIYSYQNPLGDDGLVILRSVVQERLNQIIEENNRKVEMLEKELHITRQNLIKQSRSRCIHSDCDRQDDNNSLVESVCSTSEGQASAAGESLKSDLSWVAVEEGSTTECPRTLWVPDHAVSRCTGCSTEFWLGRRRHHCRYFDCRKCGKIFCADCSENSTPLPAEHLYNPVRVCTNCYTELQRDCTEIPNQCKNTNPQPTNANTQIAASSN
ncbi:phosphatidylinositol-3,5-bisphosphate 3-phosphatase MTMR3 isoform X1 [Diabrotica undecimpunctata]|uniref:phosphatidylinositol-3,5-bisphosphate 3-phosphatase MTMR3 isoform X1 n=1 Tax=Diabrotica undecimpunctata TaxID=50387 RepID=UPI003B63B2EF